MSPTPGKNYITRRSYRDFDEYTEAFTGNQQDVYVEQLGRGKFKADLVSLSVGPFLINHIKMNRSLLIGGQMSEGVVNFGFPVAMKSGGSWMCKPLGLDTVQSYAPGREYEAITPAGFETITCSVSRSNFEIASDYEEHAGSAFNPDMNTKINCGREVKGDLISGFIRLFSQIQKNPDSLDQRSCLSECCEDISELLCQIDLAKNDSANAFRGRARSAVVARVVEYLDSMEGEPVSVQELRQRSNTSRSTLERAFKEQCGMAPKAYLMARRLNGARNMLKTTDPRSCKISDVAGRWGFWHMSQFAADYRRQFGELPSETLTRALGARFVQGQKAILL